MQHPRALALFLVFVLLFGLAGFVSAPKGKEARLKRLIAHTDRASDEAYFVSQGCEVVHQFKGSRHFKGHTAIECPEDVQLADVEEDELLQPMGLVSDQQINADDVWALGYTGTGRSVAILDTGIQSNHPEFPAGTILESKCFLNRCKNANDTDGHGTHVAGIIAARGTKPAAKGVAPGVKLYIGKVCGAGGCYTSDIMAGLDWAAAKNPDAISMSLGSTTTYTSDCDATTLAAKVNSVVAASGVPVVVAAGNSASGVSSPGCASGAITVGAVDSSDVIASFSGRGASMTSHGVVAPGVSVYSSYKKSGYATLSGTSMATPHVSALLALMRQKNPALTLSQLKSTLFSTAVDLGAGGADSVYGNGRVDALAAVNAS